MEAGHWHCPGLAGTRVTWLANTLGEPWLRIIEAPQATYTEPFHRHGWLALEICVCDVDSLYRELEGSPFAIIGKPADLDVSPDIRAMQVVGAAGEVLYLTQIKAAVAGFDLPTARCAVDRSFIAVLLADNRARALTDYERFPATTGVKFETKITVLNRAHNLPVGQRHPVATIQLAGHNLIEIDELSGLRNHRHKPSALPPGISMMSLAAADLSALPVNQRIYTIPDGPYADCRASLLRGQNGELIEIIEHH